MNELLPHLTRQFRYDDWANRETLAFLRRAAEPPSKALQLLSHIVAAEHVWLDRLHGRTPTIAVWPDIALPDMPAHLDALRDSWSALLAGSALHEMVAYQNSRGERFSSPVLDILTHIVNHGTYHRGQIATALRESGAEPPYTDWIHAARQQFI